MSEEMPMTPEEIAEDYQLPLEEVQEAIPYCESKPPERAQVLWPIWTPCSAN